MMRDGLPIFPQHEGPYRQLLADASDAEAHRIVEEILEVALIDNEPNRLIEIAPGLTAPAGIGLAIILLMVEEAALAASSAIGMDIAVGLVAVDMERRPVA